MKSLDEIINAQSTSINEKLFNDKKIPKIRVYHLDNKCIWRNSDLHILCSESLHIDSKDGISFPVKRNIYIILRMHWLVQPTTCNIISLSKLQNVLKNIDKKQGIYSEFQIADDFDFDAVLKAALCRADYLMNYIKRYSHGEEYGDKYGYEHAYKYGYNYGTSFYGSRQHQIPIELISVKNHRNYYERRNMTVEGVARYLQIPVSRARALSHCPGFPISESGRPKRTPIAALNSWLLENPDLFEVPTKSLLKYLNEKVAKKI